MEHPTCLQKEMLTLILFKKIFSAFFKLKFEKERSQEVTNWIYGKCGLNKKKKAFGSQQFSQFVIFQDSRLNPSRFSSSSGNIQTSG